MGLTPLKYKILVFYLLFDCHLIYFSTPSTYITKSCEILVQILHVIMHIHSHSHSITFFGPHHLHQSKISFKSSTSKFGTLTQLNSAVAKELKEAPLAPSGGGGCEGG